ncbi:hypothetical protein F4780DRAFT_474503 [Xylariomycetidae sp. FL0641]|nr:hypothetical protein F4780DRAFT_474503 [Xylariomycetidae sp. FL0641]
MHTPHPSYRLSLHRTRRDGVGDSAVSQHLFIVFSLIMAIMETYLPACLFLISNRAFSPFNPPVSLFAEHRFFSWRCILIATKQRISSFISIVLLPHYHFDCFGHSVTRGVHSAMVRYIYGCSSREQMAAGAGFLEPRASRRRICYYMCYFPTRTGFGLDGPGCKGPVYYYLLPMAFFDSSSSTSSLLLPARPGLRGHTPSAKGTGAWLEEQIDICERLLGSVGRSGWAWVR